MKRTIAVAAFLMVGLFLVRWIVGGMDGSTATSEPAAAAVVAKFTCSMHPQIVLDHTDVCPLCGMDLTPVRTDGGGGWEEEDPAVRLVLSESARKMADVGAVAVCRRELFKEIRTVGKVALDETRVADVAARLRGPIDKLFADSTGISVKQGDPLLSIFSTELYPAQQEFIFTRGQEVAAAQLRPGSALNKFFLPRRRLEFWGMTDEQIDKLSQASEGGDRLVVSAPISGTIVDKKARMGQFVQEGEILYTIADLSQVWLILEMYESEISWVRLGQSVQITLESQPQEPATGTVGFIEPLLNDATRTVRVRVILENLSGRFKPGMYAQALLRVPMSSDGSPAPTGLEGKYLCPLHPCDVVEQAGQCVQCGTALEQLPGAPVADPTQLDSKVLALPAEAVLTTGRRQLVYVEVEPGQYRLVEPKLELCAGAYFPIISGLKEGDCVVTHGNFLIDSQFQISGKSSLIHPGSDALGIEAEGFTAAERANIAKLPEDDRTAAVAQKICPSCTMNVGAIGVPYRLDVDGHTFYLCCKGCANSVRKDVAAALERIGEAQSPQDTPQATHDTQASDQPAGPPKGPCCEASAAIMMGTMDTAAAPPASAPAHTADHASAQTEHAERQP